MNFIWHIFSDFPMIVAQISILTQSVKSLPSGRRQKQSLPIYTSSSRGLKVEQKCPVDDEELPLHVFSCLFHGERQSTAFPWVVPDIAFQKYHFKNINTKFIILGILQQLFGVGNNNITSFNPASMIINSNLNPCGNGVNPTQCTCPNGSSFIPG